MVARVAVVSPDAGSKTAIGKNVLEYIPNSAKISEMAQTGEVAPAQSPIVQSA